MSPPRIAAAFRRRPKFNIIAFTLTVLFAVATLQIVDLWWRRDRALKTAETRATNMAIVLAEYIRGSFASADAALRQLQLHGRRVGGICRVLGARPMLHRSTAPFTACNAMRHPS